MRSCFAPICIPCDKWYITGSSFGAAAGSDAVVNDSPVGCQSRGVTEPAGESCLRSRLREFLRGLLPSDASRGIGVCHLPLRGRLEEVLLGSDFGFPGDSV